MPDTYEILSGEVECDNDFVTFIGDDEPDADALDRVRALLNAAFA